MKFSAQEEYGLRCLLTIALQPEGEGLTIPAISRREGISASHTAKLLAILRRAGYVRSSRGQIGGYTMAKDPAQIRLSELLILLGGRMYDQRFCKRHSGLANRCVHDPGCSLRDFWVKIQAAVDEAIGDTTLADLVQARRSEPAEMRLMAEAPTRRTGLPGRQ